MRQTLLFLIATLSYASASPLSGLNKQQSTLNPYEDWPSYYELPLDPSFPTMAAWGVWGYDDVYGALNHITPETILSAAREEIKTGTAINLNLELDISDPPVSPTRKPLNRFFQSEEGYTDDVLVMNTQISTQYDGLRHFPFSEDGDVSTYRFYNDLIASYDEVIGASPSKVLSIQTAAQKGIAGRGVLLDYARWMDSQSKPIDVFSSQTFSAAELDVVARFQGLWRLVGAAGRHSDRPHGLGPTVQRLESGGAADSAIRPRQLDRYGGQRRERALAVGEEAGARRRRQSRVREHAVNGTIDGEPRSLHQVFIGGWGHSILEFLDLEQLSEELHASGRSTFFLTIQTLNVVSGIASPPNAMALL